MPSHRNRSSMSAPLSTKILLSLGIALVFAGFGIAGWQRLGSDEAHDANSPVGNVAQHYLPDLRMIAVYLGVIVIAILAGGYVLVRSRRRRAGY